MPTKRCCCNQTSCFIGEDAFDRDDENPVTGNWHEVSGDWEIDGNELNSISDGPLITTLRQPPPTRVGNGYNTRIIVDLVIPASGDRTYGVITGYRGAGDYSWIKFEYVSSTGELLPTFYSSPTTAVMDTTTHPGTEIYTANPGSNVQVVICCSDVEWTFAIGEVHWLSCAGGGLANLPTAPLGGVGFLKGRFDNWQYYIHWESRLDCETCLCFCADPDDPDDYKCMPECLLLTVTQDGTGEYDCSCLDDLTLTLTQARARLDPPPITLLPTARPTSWFSEAFECEGVRYWFLLTCVAPEIFSLSLLLEGDIDPENLAGFLIVDPLTPPTSTQCNPIIYEYAGAARGLLVTCDIVDPPSTGQRVSGCSECYAGSVPTITWTVTVTECPS